MRAIIGPNGAGKTTMMDVITGKTRPTDGRGDLRGDARPDEARRGDDRPARHRPEVPDADRLRDAHGRGQHPPRAEGRPAALPDAVRRARPRAERERIDALLERVRLTATAHRQAAELSHGQKQWLEIGMLLAQEPKLLLVDEPAAGMTDQETADTADLLREIARTRSVVVVEHDMAFVRDLGVKVTCLHEGTVLAEGSLDQVSADERVDRSVSRARVTDIAASRRHLALLRRLPGAARRLGRSRSRARSPACSAATASARPRSCGPSSATGRSPGGSIRFDGRDISKLKPYDRARRRHRLRAAGPRDLSAAHRDARTWRPASRP